MSRRVRTVQVEHGKDGDRLAPLPLVSIGMDAVLNTLAHGPKLADSMSELVFMEMPPTPEVGLSVFYTVAANDDDKVDLEWLKTQIEHPTRGFIVTDAPVFQERLWTMFYVDDKGKENYQGYAYTYQEGAKPNIDNALKINPDIRVKARSVTRYFVVQVSTPDAFANWSRTFRGNLEDSNRTSIQLTKAFKQSKEDIHNEINRLFGDIDLIKAPVRWGRKGRGGTGRGSGGGRARGF